VVGEEWATTKLEKENKAKSTIKRERWNLAQLNREIGDRPLCEIAPPELLTAFRRVEARGRYYTVGRLRSTASRVFQFGVGASYCSSDPTRDLKHALTKAPKGNPRPALTDPDDVGDLMRRIEVYDAKNGGLVRYALKLIALTMVRPGELRLEQVGSELNRKGFPNRAEHDSSSGPEGGWQGWRMGRLFAFG
jgi:integrase